MLKHNIRPVAGRMRPKTSESGIFSTKRSSDVSVSRLTRMFVPKPKKAFQSPDTQSWVFAFIFPRFLLYVWRATRCPLWE